MEGLREAIVHYLEGVPPEVIVIILAMLPILELRGAIPWAVEQIDLLLRLTAASTPNPRRMLDIGCGDGVLGRALMDRFPKATCGFVDNSEPMLERLNQKLSALLIASLICATSIQPD